MGRLYGYVGPPEIARAASSGSSRASVTSPADIRDWIAESGQPLDARDSVTATFVVDADGCLWIADRHSEHVACARGGQVLSAGEMTFTISAEAVEATYVTNQSTGYCPQPGSWPAVAAALDRAGIGNSGDFDWKCEFRRCQCGQINIVKDGVFECGVCAAELPEKWNFM